MNLNNKNTLSDVKSLYLSILTMLCMFSFNAAYAKEYKYYTTNHRNHITHSKVQHYSDKELNFKHNLYIGIGFGKTATAFGKIKADYKDQPESWKAPGSFQKSKFESDESFDLQVSLGTQVTQNVRIDFNYLHYSDLSLKLNTHSLLPLDEKLTSYTGGYKFDNKPDISSDVAMLNIYYYLDRLIGRFKIRPYVGAGIGMAQNVISDYIVFDGGAYIIPELQDTLQEPGTPIRISNIKTRHKGGTVGGFAYSFEVGASYNLTQNCIIDVFSRYVNLGTVESESIVSTYNLFNSTSNTIPVGEIYNIGAPAGEATSYYLDWKETGNLSVVDIGVKLRFLF